MADLESEPTSESTPGRSSGVYSDSEEEEDRRGDEADAYGYSFGYDSNRTTFFRTSAERGQWKSNPMPLRPLQTRKSLPVVSRIPSPAIPAAETTLRTISEPAPSIPSAENDIAPQEQDLPDRATEETTPNSASIPINPPTEEGAHSPHTLPSLSSDRESSIGVACP